jgi:prepilin-type N-terminal cleavage/methylation domain-containing protein
LELTKKTLHANQRGMSFIELMIAILVLTVGILGSSILLSLSVGTNYRNRQQSNSTVIAEMVMEKISSVKASTAPILTVPDCTGAARTINTAGSAGGTGASLLPSGQVDFSQAAVAGYSMIYVTCGTQQRQAGYDVRWNIRTPTPYTKLVTVSVKLTGSGTDRRVFSLPVTIRSVAGQGN